MPEEYQSTSQITIKVLTINAKMWTVGIILIYA